MYKFYIFNEGNPPSGPYSATEIKEMELEKGTLVSELTINDGEPTPIEKVDIEYFSREESDEQGTYTATVKASEESIEKTVEEPDEEKPSIIGKWSWGAFGLPVIWGLFNGVYWPAIVSVVAFVAQKIVAYNEGLEFVNLIILAILLIIRIVLGVNGNKMAWRAAKKHQSISKFESSQKRWGIIGLAALAVTVFVTIIVLSF